MDTSVDLSKSLNFFSDRELREDLMQKGNMVSLKKGDVIVRDGQYIKFLPIVINGAIRVYQQKEDREVLLYYVRAQETCTMSLAAAYFNNKSTSHGVAIEPTEALIFPSTLIMEWQLKYSSWNKYVMRMFRSRYDQLIGSLERVVFEHINVRVMEYLKQKSEIEETKMLNLSHQDLANELGTTRVVISRILKQFEKENKIELLRGAIRLL